MVPLRSSNTWAVQGRSHAWLFLTTPPANNSKPQSVRHSIVMVFVMLSVAMVILVMTTVILVTVKTAVVADIY